LCAAVAGRRSAWHAFPIAFEITKEKAVTTTASEVGSEAERPEAPTVERLEDSAHRKVEQAAAGVAEAEREIRRAAADAANRIRRSEEELAEILEQNVRKVREYIEKNPLQSAGIAFAAGIVLSSLLRR